MVGDQHSEIYGRIATSSTPYRRRLISTLFFVVIISGMWALIRWPLQRYMASNRIGDFYSSALIFETIRKIDPSISESDEIVGQSVFRGEPSFLFLSTNSASIKDDRVLIILSDDFFPKASFLVPENYRGAFSPAVDRDHDGNPEFIYRPWGRYSQSSFCATLRMKDGGLELVGFAEESTNIPLFEWQWANSKKEKKQDLIGIDVATTATPSTSPTSTQRTIIAHFAWTGPGGVLRMRSNDGRIVDRFPFDNPIRLPEGVDIEKLMDELMPRSSSDHGRPH